MTPPNMGNIFCDPPLETDIFSGEPPNSLYVNDYAPWENKRM